MPDPTPASKRVLLLEDDDDTREALADLLQRNGYAIREFSHADGNLAAMTDWRPDIALLDLRLPGRSGAEAAADLLAAFPSLRLVFLTGETQSGRLKTRFPQCLLLTKPIDGDVLVALLHCL